MGGYSSSDEDYISTEANFS